MLLISTPKGASLIQEIRNVQFRETGVVEFYATYDQFNDPGFRNFMVPRQATEIKRYYDCGFGYQSCSISCKVSRKDLEAFAKEKGYKFKAKKCAYFLGYDPVLDELRVDGDDAKNYLRCTARDGEHEVEIPGWGNFGDLHFVYDIEKERLYGFYYD